MQSSGSFDENRSASNKQTSERASSKPASERELRAVREQARNNMAPIILSEDRDFPVILKQAKDRGASIKFYGARRALLALSDKNKITFCHGRMKQDLMW